MNDSSVVVPVSWQQACALLRAAVIPFSQAVLQRATTDGESRSTVKTLRSVEVLQCLSMSQLQLLAEAMRQVAFTDGEFVIKQGEEGRCVLWGLFFIAGVRGCWSVVIKQCEEGRC